jgi:hypothetical protein
MGASVTFRISVHTKPECDTASTTTMPAFEVYGPDEGKHIYDYECALRLLMRCAMNRREAADIDQRILRSVHEVNECDPT